MNLGYLTANSASIHSTNIYYMPIGARLNGRERETIYFSVLLGGSATKELNRRKREVGVVLGVILNKAIGVDLQQVITEARRDGGVDIGKKPSRKRE